MTVRLSPHRFRWNATEAGLPSPHCADETATTPIDGFPDPVPEVVSAGTSATPLPASDGDQTGSGPGTGVVGDPANRVVTSESRIALREVRRQRRRTAWLCAAVVAGCLALTIIVVSLAQARPAPRGASASFAPARSSTPLLGNTTPPTDPHSDAPASEGGIR
jgi:hypothetical protein